jgi:uncharacterized protein (TIGR01777 family)
MSLRVVVTGPTGLVGTALREVLEGRGDAVVGLSRSGSGPTWDVDSGRLDPAALAGADAIVNLAGEPIFGRWTAHHRERIETSRVRGTALLVRSLRALPATARPGVFVSGSAVGYYGDRGDEILDEASPPGTGFLPHVARAWEREAIAARELGVRVALVRTGVVQSTDGGALAVQLPLFRVGLGGRAGSGNQWLPWIHIDDIVALFVFLIDHGLDGPFLGTAPESVRQKDYAHTLGRVLHRPSFGIAPAPMLRLALGRGVADELLLASQRTSPKATLGSGFTFRFPTLEPALRDLLAVRTQ